MPRVLLIVAAIVAAGFGAIQGQPQSPVPTPAAATREDAYRSNNVGVALLEQYNHAEAAESFRRALAADPGLTLAKINLAIALFYVPDTTAAATAAKEAAAAAPDAPQPQYILGLIAKSENQTDAAQAAFEKVLAIDATDLGARVNLAQLRMQKREYDAAVDLLRPAVATEPYHVTATYNLGVALTRAGKTEEGQQVIARFQALREGGYGTAFSNNYLEQGRYAEAVPSTGAERELVEAAAPAVAFSVVRSIPETIGGPITLVDLDRDGDLDLVAPRGIALNDAGAFRDVTAAKGLTTPGPSASAAAAGPQRMAVVAGDYDNDERTDLFVLGAGTHQLLHQRADGTFEDVSAAAGIPKTAGTHGAVAFVDADHDGDLDVVLAGGLAGATNLLLRNNGNGTFADVSAASGIAAASGVAVGVVPTDFDNRRDVDLLVARGSGAPLLLKNLRDGTFKDVAGDVGLAAVGAGTARVSAVAAGDVNKDGFTDFFFGREAVGVLAASDGRGGFTLADVAGTAGVTAALLADLDNDGLLDLVAATSAGIVQVRSLGLRESGGRHAAVWAAPVPLVAANAADLAGTGALAAGDLDGDGDTDVIASGLRGGAATVDHVVVLRNDGGSRGASLRVRLAGRVSNRDAVGAKVEIRAGSLRQKLETASAWPAVAPADLVFGLGARRAADVVRVLWPAGIVQAEIPPVEAGPRPAAGAASHATLAFTELDRKPSSCPYLFTWNGERFEFITDFMGGGEMGYLHAPGVIGVPDPEEYTRIDGSRLVPRGGRYELRVTNELEETLFLDRARLLVVDHPAAVEVHPREGAFAPPFPPFELYAVAGSRPVARALDDRGGDVTERLAAVDRRFVDGLPLAKVRGYARPHTLTLDLGPAAPGAGAPLLLLTGWTDYAFSTDNVAASQAGMLLDPPSLQVKDASGIWRTVRTEIGIPVGRPQTIVVDLTGIAFTGGREVRIATSMRVYWDAARVATRDAGVRPRVSALDAAVADLAWRGFSAEVSPDGREPFGYDYGTVSTVVPWKLMPGRYTREGDVRELLRAADDFFVVSRPGDAIALSFDATRVPPLPAGWSRTFLLHSVGYSKEMDQHSASPDQAAPMPFRTMTRYPYAAPERYPDTPAHRAYVERWNTRVVGRTLPPLELAAGAPGAGAVKPTAAAGGAQ